MADETNSRRASEGSDRPSLTEILGTSLDVIVGLAVLYLFLRKDVERS